MSVGFLKYFHVVSYCHGLFLFPEINLDFSCLLGLGNGCQIRVMAEILGGMHLLRRCNLLIRGDAYDFSLLVRNSVQEILLKFWVLLIFFFT